MLIDHPQKIRAMLLNTFPLPEDREIVMYDVRFKNLIGKNIQELYTTQLAQHKELSKEYVELSKKIADYESFIDNLKLVAKSYTTQDYMLKIKELEAEYTTKFGNIRNLEKRIALHENKIEKINKDIANQKALEEETIKQMKNRKTERLNKDLAKLAEMQSAVKFFQDYYSEYSLLIKMIEREKVFEENLLDKTTKKNIKCRECGKRYYPSESSILKRIQSLDSRLQVHQQNYTKLKEKRDNYNERIAALRFEVDQLRTEIQMSNNSYIKKTPEVLKLEGEKFKIFEELEKIQKEYQELVARQGREFKELKRRIDVYRTSLSNYLEATNISKELLELKPQLKEIQEKMTKLETTLNSLAEFMEMKYKVYERDLSVHFENKVQFNLFERDGFYFKKMSIIKYENIESLYLDVKKYEELNTFLVKKFRVFIEDKEINKFNKEDEEDEG